MPMIKRASIVGSFALSLVVSSTTSAQSPATKPASPAIDINHDALKNLHWQLACQASTFSEMTFFDMVDRLHAMGVHHITLAPGQQLSAEYPGVKIGQEMSDGDIANLRGKLQLVKMDVVSYGPAEADDDSGRNKQLFAFAKKVKVKTLVVLVTHVSLESLDKLANDSGIRLAIMTQIDAGWSCQTFLQLVAGRSPVVGFCMDLSALEQAGFIPAECVKTLGQRVIEINLTDPSAKDDQIRSTLNELRREKFQGVFEVQSRQGAGDERLSHFISSANAFSAAVTEISKDKIRIHSVAKLQMNAVILARPMG